MKVSKVSSEKSLHFFKNYTSVADLIKKMEKNRIGTDASVASHVDGLNNKGYVKTNKDGRMEPSELGTVMIDCFNRVDPDLTSP